MLTATEVKNAKPLPDGKIRKISDSGGLQLHVMPTGTKVWRIAYRFGGKQKTLTIGQYPAVSLSSARLAREEAKAKLRAGSDPSGEAARGNDDTFNAVADDWLEKIRSDGLSASTIEARTWQLQPLRRAFGTKSVGDIKAKDVLACLKAIHQATPATAERCRIVVGQVFRFAVASDICDADPTSSLRGAMPTHKGKHHAAAVEEQDIRGLLKAIEGYKGHVSTALALRLAPHVFLRSSEIRNLRIEMVDLENDLIHVPADFIKGKKQDHLIPLSRQAKEIVEMAISVSDGSGTLFAPARGKDRVMSENTLTAALRRMGFSSAEVTFHGFRTTASTILHEAFPEDTLVIETQLTHKDKNQIRGAYNRAKYLPRRRELMQHLSDKLDQIVQS